MNDGGPAFPSKVDHQPEIARFQTQLPGMSLRDYFAAKALQGELSAQGEDGVGIYKEERLDFLANFAYLIADAMLKERLK